jgi:secreted Zn-dependent insulinase-like peptidase
VPNLYKFTGFRLQTKAFTTHNTDYDTLENGVRLVFLNPNESHKNAYKASISVTLSHGHFQASNYPEGFAHLYEHMLFNASTKYQNTDALDNHLFTYHGQTNGWTENLTTNFQLNCDHEGFVEACEILIDRLSSPLFRKEDIEKEIVAINAEFLASKGDPVRQLLSVQKASCNPDHPFSLFSAGNAKTLGEASATQTQILLQQYHKEVMQGPHVSICIGIPMLHQSQAVNSNLRNMIQKAFSKKCLTETRQKHANHLPPVYLASQLNCLISVRQDLDRPQLITSYILPKPTCLGFNEHRNALYVMICHLLESKHKQGLFYWLKNTSLAYDVHSYFKSIDTQTDELVISVQLSSQGAKQAIHVYNLIQLYIDFLNTKGIEQWRFREKADQFSMSLHMNKGSSLLEECIEISQGISQEGFPHSTSEEAANPHKQLSNKQDWQYLPDIFAKLNANNTRLYFISPSATCQYSSKHFETLFSISGLNTQTSSLPMPGPTFTKPRQNPYMSSEHPLVKAQLPPTALVHLQSEKVNFKFYQDIRFSLPNGECYISITEPEMHRSVKQIAIKRVWLSCLNEFLATQFFDVELASIHFRVYAHHHGICIHTGGLSERQLLVCIELINSIKSYKATQQDIKRHISKTRKRLQDRPKQRPLNQLFASLNEYYQEDVKKLDTILGALKKVTVQEVYETQKQYFNYNFIESLLIGNWSTSAAERFYQQLNSRFNTLHSVFKPKTPIPELKSGQHIHRYIEKMTASHFVWHFVPLLNMNEKSTAAGNKKLKLRLAARSLVLEKLLSHTMFDVLRQQQKMGYELGVGYKPISSYPGVAIYVVSETHSVGNILDAMLEVIENTRNMLTQNLSTEKKVSLNKIVDELIKQVSPRDNDISQTANRAWLHFDDENPVLGFEELIDALRSLKVSDINLALTNLASTTLGQILFTSSGHQNVHISKFKIAKKLVS